MEIRVWTRRDLYVKHGSNIHSVGGDFHASGHRGGHVAAERLLFLGSVCEGAASRRAQKELQVGIRAARAEAEWPCTWRQPEDEGRGRLVRH